MKNSRESLHQINVSGRALASFICMHLLLPVCFSLTFSLTGAQEIAINEIMSSNGSTLADQDGDFEDWVELFNYGDVAINLKGFGLSDASGNPFRWVFPDILMEPGEYLLVWASGKDRKAGLELHTNFSINSAGEEIILTTPDGNLVDSVPPVPIPRDISYGRTPDGTGTFIYFTSPSPGSENPEDGYMEFLSPPSFSRMGGFYDDTLWLSISSTDPDATILYTLDGSEPDQQNLSGRTWFYKNQYPQHPGDPVGELLSEEYRTHSYKDILAIVDRSDEPDRLTHISTTWHGDPGFYFPEQSIPKATVVRARVVKDGALPSPVITHTYFPAYDGENPWQLPVLSLSIQEDGLFDYSDGMYVAGKVFDDWRQNNPNMEVNGGRPANYNRREHEWERPAHLEFFEDGELLPAFRQDLGVRIHGGWSRSRSMKSLRFYARQRYGASAFNHPIFPELPYDEYQRLILRNSGNDQNNTMFRDAAIQKVFGPLGFCTQAYRPVLLFINGEYWGIHNIRERYDKHYLKRVHGVDSENIDLLTRRNIIKEGDSRHYLETLEYIEEHGLRDQEHYDYIRTRIDTDNFMDYQIANIFIRNHDWPQNNIDYWRLRTNEYLPDAELGHDGRWRWLMFDTDMGFRWETHNSLTHALATGDREWSTFLLRKLMENETFRNDFINRFADLMNSLLLPSRVNSVIADYKAVIEPEMPGHLVRWSQPGTMNGWHNNVNSMINFVNNRWAYQRMHLRQHFGILGYVQLTVNVAEQEQGHIRVNTIEISHGISGIKENPYPWTGIYFHDVPITLQALPVPGYTFDRWEGLPSGTPAKTQQIFTDTNASLTAHFREASLIHYWHFNNLPDHTLVEVPADQSMLNDAFISYPGTGEGYMDRVSEDGGLNALPGTESSYALRVRNPSATRDLLLTLPTTGFDNISLSYVLRRTPNGATRHRVSYRTSTESEWILHESFTATEDYELYNLQFTDPEVTSNPEFEVKISFIGSAAHGGSGNNRLDNIRLEGAPYMATNTDNLSELEQQEVNRPSVYYSGGFIHVQNPWQGSTILQLFGLDGRMMQLHEIPEPGIYKYPFSPASGIYIVRMIHPKMVHSTRVKVWD